MIAFLASVLGLNDILEVHTIEPAQVQFSLGFCMLGRSSLSKKSSPRFNHSVQLEDSPHSFKPPLLPFLQTPRDCFGSKRIFTQGLEGQRERAYVLKTLVESLSC